MASLPDDGSKKRKHNAAQPMVPPDEARDWSSTLPAACPSFLRDGRAWSYLAPHQQLCEVRPQDKRAIEEDWRVHDGRLRQKEGRPPDMERKKHWPPNMFTVPYMTEAGPLRFCIRTGVWGSSGFGGKVAVPCPPPLSLPAAQAVGTFSQVHHSYVVESRHAEQKAATHVVIDQLETAAWVYPRKRH